MLETRAVGVGVYSRRRAVHPVRDRAVGIVIERVHVGAPHRAVGLYAVPVLPDRRRALGDGIEPRGIFATKQKVICRPDVAVVAERMEKIRRADKAGFKMPGALHKLV